MKRSQSLNVPATRYWLLLGSVLLVSGIVAFGLFVLLTPPLPMRIPVQGASFSNVEIIQPGQWRRERASIVVENSTISEITDYASVNPAEADVRFVLPGLVNMHVHHPPSALPVPRQLFPLMFLMNGVTSVRDAGDLDGNTVKALKASIEATEFPGPRMFACGPFLDGPNPTWASSVVVKDVSTAVAAVKAVRDSGYDCVKVYEGLSAAALKAILAAARTYSLPVIGHVPFSVVYPGQIADVQHFHGVPFLRPPADHSFEHQIAAWSTLDEKRLQELADRIIKSGTRNTPTLVSRKAGSLFGDFEALRKSPEGTALPRLFADVIWNPEVGIKRPQSDAHISNLKLAVQREQRLAKVLVDRGAIVNVGTDTMTAFVVPGFDMLQEMKLLVEAGISVEQVLEMATSQAGGQLRENLGQMKVGAPADFLVFREDPTKDLENWNTLEWVVANGRAYNIAEMRQKYSELKRYWSHPVTDLLQTSAVYVAMQLQE